MKNGVYYDTLKEIIKINSFSFRSKYTAFYRGGPGLRVIKVDASHSLLAFELKMDLPSTGSAPGEKLRIRSSPSSSRNTPVVVVFMALS